MLIYIITYAGETKVYQNEVNARECLDILGPLAEMKIVPLIDA